MMSHEDRARHAWLSMYASQSPPELETVRAEAGRFDRRIRNRNRRETLAAVAVIVTFAAYAALLPSLLMRTASLAVIGGTAVVLWQLHRRAGSLAASDRMDLLPLLHHRRMALDRQRRALASVPAWYVGPLVPGVAMFLIAPLIEGRGPVAWTLMAVLATTGVFGFVIWLNRRGADALGRAIAEIDAQLSES